VLKHYFVAAWSNFRRSPLAASINVLTLALGLVCFILASSITGFWSRAEQHFANAGRTVVVTTQWRLRDGSGTDSGVAVPASNPRAAAYLQADFPQIESVARVAGLGGTTLVQAGDRVLRMRGIAADATFLDIFDLPFVEGDPRAALRTPGSVILTKEAAHNLYGDARAVGKSITLLGNVDVTVTGVIDRIPEPSHMGHSAAAPLRFDLLASRDVFESMVRGVTGGRDTTQLPDDWFAGPGTTWQNVTYVLLPADGSLTPDALRSQLPPFVERHVPEEQRKTAQLTLDVVPVTRLLGMAVRDALFPRGSAISVPLLLLVLGAIVLTVACINFANLATARATGRAREAGVRRAIGAQPRQVMAQHLLEAGVLTSAAMAVALALVVLLMPVVERTAGIDLRLLWSADYVGRGVLSLLALGTVVSLGAGFYPALVLSRVQPALAVRTAQARTGPRSLTGLLVGVQFTFAAFLLIAVSIVHQQNQRLESAGRDIATAPLLVIENRADRTGLPQERLRQELSRLPAVSSATTMQTLPWAAFLPRMPFSATPSASTSESTAFVYAVGYDFFETLDIELLAGRDFDPQRADDVAIMAPNPSRAQNIVISRALANELGSGALTDVVDRTLYMPTSVTGEAAARAFHVIGVVENKTLAVTSRYGSRPNIYLFYPALPLHVVRLAGNDVGGALAAVDALWKRLAPDVAIERRFVADDFNQSYESFARVNQAFTTLALLAWLISTIGLYAMAVLVAGRRVREIAIRKTLGARTGQIVRLLLGSFSRPVLVANVIAWPFAYLAGRAYLNVFVDPMPLTVWPFVMGLAVSLAVSWIAVGGQTWRAARSAPVRMMRHE
jgi:putative ABC transport system permease protein